MIIIKGYKINSTDLSILNEVITEMQKICINKANEEYHKFLSKEIESAVDDIARNIIQRPEDKSILEAVAPFVENKIAYAIANNLPVSYNFSIGVNIFTFNNSLFLQIETNNDAYLNIFGGIKNLIPFSVKDEEFLSSDDKSDNAKIWENIRKCYMEMGINPYFVQLTPYGKLEIEKDKLDFQTAKQRIRAIARRETLGKFFNMLSNGQQAPPNKVMEYMEEAIAMLETPTGKNELKERARRLHGIIQNITYEMISANPLDRKEEIETKNEENEISEEFIFEEQQKEHFKNLKIPEDQEEYIEKIGNEVQEIK